MSENIVSEKVISDAMNIKLTEKRGTSYKGGFYTLRSAKLVDPHDEDRYNVKQASILKSQGLVFCFTFFWAHIIDKSSILKPTRSRIPFYMIMVGVPSLVHAFYASSSISGIVNELDEKYAPAYEKYYLSKVKTDKKIEDAEKKKE